MKRLLAFAILLVASPATAQQVAPNWSQGSMNATTTSTQTITETINREVYGGALSTYSGTNVQPSTTITDAAATYSVVDTAQPWQLEITTRPAGIVESVITNRDIDITSTTTSLSVFSQ